MKKRMLSLLLALTLCLSCGVIAASAEGPEYDTMLISLEPADPVEVHVSIAIAGELVLTDASVTAHDVDNDGVLSINDALVCAHDQYYEGGADAGFGSEETQYGLSMTRLWGVDGNGAYGYFRNDKSALSLKDSISAGDYIVAYTYKDTTGYSDLYSFFPFQAASTYVRELSVTLSAATYDADWNPITVPVAGATITINGEPTEFVTNETGDTLLTFDKVGTYIVSATSESVTLVPPACIVIVSSFPDSCGHWAEAEIETVVAAGLMNGTGKNFDVLANMTRAQMVTTLYRMAGSPAVEGELTFTDVTENAYYADAVIWASGNGIVTGTGNNKFSPNANVTRQELATFLHRYAVLQGFDVSVGENTNILSYDDAFDIPSWAMPAMQWACGAGLISGTTTSTLSPTGNATRAQVAVILARFMENVQ